MKSIDMIRAEVATARDAGLRAIHSSNLTEAQAEAAQADLFATLAQQERDAILAEADKVTALLAAAAAIRAESAQ